MQSHLSKMVQPIVALGDDEQPLACREMTCILDLYYVNRHIFATS